MGLIKNKIKNDNWLKGFAKKTATVGLAGGIAFSSFFGFTGCDAKEVDAEANLPENNIVSNEDATTQESIDELKSMIDSIKGMVESLGITDTAILTKIDEIEAKINALTTNFSNKNAVIDEMATLISDIKEEIIAIKLRLGVVEENMISKEVINEIITRLGAIEEGVVSKEVIEEIINQLGAIEEGMISKETITEIINRLDAIEDGVISKEVIDEIIARLDVIENNNISREEMNAVDNKIAKINARLAIEKSFDNNYMDVRFGEDYSAVTSINGDVVVDRGVNDDYAYYNKELDMTFASVDEEEFFIAGSNMSFDFAQMLTQQLEDEGFVINKESSSEDIYEFANEEGVTITVNINSGLCTSARLTDNNNEDNNISIETATYNDFKNELSRCKYALKSIGLFESFKKELDNSLDYRYKSVTAINKSGDVAETGTGVFSNHLAAQEMITMSKDKVYTVGNGSNITNAVFDESNNLIHIEEFEDSTIYTIDEDFKDMATANMYGADKNTITQDENGTFTIISEEENRNTKIDIAFNEDLSVDLKVYMTYNGEVFDVSYHVEKLTKAQFDETYNRILDIVELAKENQAGVTAE